jgi:hypothetical protein
MVPQNRRYDRRSTGNLRRSTLSDGWAGRRAFGVTLLSVRPKYFHDMTGIGLARHDRPPSARAFAKSLAVVYELVQRASMTGSCACGLLTFAEVGPAKRGGRAVHGHALRREMVKDVRAVGRRERQGGR